jgi:hypothetical protein
MMDIQPIETVYKGYRFRSRLEARWAVFFDALGVEWDYEKEGFDLQNGDKYLPDFYIKKPECWIEIKPEREKTPILNLTEAKENERCGLLAAQTRKYVDMVCGSPYPGKYTITAFKDNFISEDWNKYLESSLKNDPYWMFIRLLDSAGRNQYQLDWLKRGQEERGWAISPHALNQKPYFVRDEMMFAYCEHHNSLGFGYISYSYQRCPECGSYDGVYGVKKNVYARCFDNDNDAGDCGDLDYLENKTLLNAFNKARSARFEFGESG